jgi:hypothetical protein
MRVKKAHTQTHHQHHHYQYPLLIKESSGHQVVDIQSRG